MKISTKAISIILASLMLLTPIAAQQNQLDACTQATMDAQNDVNTALWVGAGCILGFWAIIGAYLIEPTPQATKLIGKDANYVALYTDCYKAEAKKRQTNYSLYGCVGCGVASLVYYVIVLAAVATVDDPYDYNY